MSSPVPFESMSSPTAPVSSHNSALGMVFVDMNAISDSSSTCNSSFSSSSSAAETLDVDDDCNHIMCQSSKSEADNDSLMRHADLGMSSDDESQTVQKRRNGETTKAGLKEDLPVKALKRPHFPTVLYDLVSSAERNGFGSIISWSADGTSFLVYNPTKFMSDVAPKYFPNQSQFRSFERMLNLWCFSRQDTSIAHPVAPSHTENGISGHRPRHFPVRRPYAYPKQTKMYRHEHFRRGHLEDCKKISRCGIKGTSVRVSGVTFHVKAAQELSIVKAKKKQGCTSPEANLTASKSKAATCSRTAWAKKSESVTPSPHLSESSTRPLRSAQHQTFVPVSREISTEGNPSTFPLDHHQPQVLPNNVNWSPIHSPRASAAPARHLVAPNPVTMAAPQPNYQNLVELHAQGRVQQLLHERQMQLTAILLQKEQERCHHYRSAFTSMNRANLCANDDRGFLDLLADSANQRQEQEHSSGQIPHQHPNLPIPGQFDDADDESDCE